MQMPVTLNYSIDPSEIDRMREAIEELDGHLAAVDDSLKKVKGLRAEFHLYSGRTPENAEDVDEQRLSAVRVQCD